MLSRPEGLFATTEIVVYEPAAAVSGRGPALSAASTLGLVVLLRALSALVELAPLVGRALLVAAPSFAGLACKFGIAAIDLGISCGPVLWELLGLLASALLSALEGLGDRKAARRRAPAHMALVGVAVGVPPGPNPMVGHFILSPCENFAGPPVTQWDEYFVVGVLHGGCGYLCISNTAAAPTELAWVELPCHPAVQRRVTQLTAVRTVPAVPPVGGIVNWVMQGAAKWNPTPAIPNLLEEGEAAVALIAAQRQVNPLAAPFPVAKVGGAAALGAAAGVLAPAGLGGAPGAMPGGAAAAAGPGVLVAAGLPGPAMAGGLGFGAAVPPPTDAVLASQVLALQSALADMKVGTISDRKRSKKKDKSHG